MNKKRHIMNLNRLKGILEGRGYDTSLTESKLVARNNSFKFVFTNKKNYTHIHGHLHERRVTGRYVVSGSPGNRRKINKEYASILRSYYIGKV